MISFVPMKEMIVSLLCGRGLVGCHVVLLFSNYFRIVQLQSLHCFEYLSLDID